MFMYNLYNTIIYYYETQPSNIHLIMISPLLILMSTNKIYIFIENKRQKQRTEVNNEATI